MTIGHHKSGFGTSILLVAMLMVRPALASKNYPETIRSELTLNYLPTCVLCHENQNGGSNTVVTPFGISLKQLRVVGNNTGSLRAALRQMEQYGIDSDCDGVTDIDELTAFQNPNEGLGDASCGPMPPPLETGCAVGTGTPRGTGSLWEVVGLAVLIWRRTRPRSC